MSEPVIGVFGTGQFSAYLIAALRKGGHTGEIILSPYNRQKAEALAQLHDCVVADDDAKLLAKADWLLIAVRPGQLDPLLGSLTISPRHLVISAAAGVSADVFRRHLGETTPVFRIIPASYIEHFADGIVPLYPDSAEVRAVLGRAGAVVAFSTEEQFDLTIAGSCMSGWMYRFMASLEEWFLERGFSPEQARLVVSQNIAGAAAVARNDPRDLKTISDEIATEGTFTKLGLDHLLTEKAAEPWRFALELVQNKLDGQRG